MRQEIITPWKSFFIKHLKAILATIPMVAAVVGLLALWGGEEWRQRYIDNVLIHAVYWVVILHLSWEIFSHECPATFRLPQVITVRRNEHVLIVERSPWLGVGVMTTIYVLENDFERLVCIGEVINVQVNDMVQIVIRTSEQGYISEEDVWNTLERTDRSMILIKPGPIPGGT